MTSSSSSLGFGPLPIQQEDVGRHLADQEVSDVDNLERKDGYDVMLDERLVGVGRRQKYMQIGLGMKNVHDERLQKLLNFKDKTLKYYVLRLFF